MQMPFGVCDFAKPVENSLENKEDLVEDLKKRVCFFLLKKPLGWIVEIHKQSIKRLK